MPSQTPNLHIPYPVPDDTVDVPRDMQAMANAIDPVAAMAVPAGCIMMWPGAQAPNGWMIMGPAPNNTVDSASNPGLAAIYGQSGGKVTIPNMQDYFAIGSGVSVALGQVGGANTVALNDVKYMPNHSHNGKTQGMSANNPHSHSVSSNWMAADIVGYAYPPAGSGMGPSGIGTNPADIQHTHVIDAQGGGVAHENRPLCRGLNFIIKLG